MHETNKQLKEKLSFFLEKQTELLAHQIGKATKQEEKKWFQKIGFEKLGSFITVFISILGLVITFTRFTNELTAQREEREAKAYRDATEKIISFAKGKPTTVAEIQPLLQEFSSDDQRRFGEFLALLFLHDLDFTQEKNIIFLGKSLDNSSVYRNYLIQNPLVCDEIVRDLMFNLKSITNERKVKIQFNPDLRIFQFENDKNFESEKSYFETLVVVLSKHLKIQKEHSLDNFRANVSALRVYLPSDLGSSLFADKDDKYSICVVEDC